MSEAIPFITVKRFVQNIGQERIDALQDRLIEDVEGADVNPDTVRGIFVPADRLFTTIIGRSEFLRIQQALGPDRLDEEGVVRLEGRLEEAFAEHPETMDVPTLPFQQQHWGPMPKLNLIIAKNAQATKERYQAQGVIKDFLGPGVPEIRFGRARRIVPVWFAAAETQEDLDALNRTKAMVEEGAAKPEKERPLPGITKFGKIKTDHSTAYIRS
jgi:hypothetical protein